MTEIMPVPRNSHITVLRPPSIPTKIFFIMVLLEAVMMGLITFMGVRSWFPVSGKILAAVFLGGTAILAIVTAISFLRNPPGGKEPKL